MRFDAFMRRALYDPEHGYYRRKKDPFGTAGDFYTASQVQPLFGRVIAAEADALCPGAQVWELGPGRGEMSAYFGSRYRGIDYGEELPPDLNGFLFANEFFDALPVRVGIKEDGRLFEMQVEAGEWVRGPELDAEAAAYVRRYWPVIADGDRFEIGEEALAWLDCISARMKQGRALIIDYGYTSAETARFPQGTLMSYRKHWANPEVLSNAGEQDITAHVAFDALIDRARVGGYALERNETLAQLVLRAVERDESLVATPEAQKQLKLILFGMGEAFRCLLFRKAGANKEGPDCSGPVWNLG